MGFSLGLHGMFPPAQLAQPLFYAIHSFAVEGKPCLFTYSRANRHIARGRLHGPPPRLPGPSA